MKLSGCVHCGQPNDEQIVFGVVGFVGLGQGFGLNWILYKNSISSILNLYKFFVAEHAAKMGFTSQDKDWQMVGEARVFLG